MKVKRNKRFHAEVSTASLNDIMFFLLLFFLIVSTIANPNVIKIMLPKSDAADTLSKQQVVITVTEDKKYYLGKQEIPYENLAAAIAEEVKKTHEPTLLLRMARNLQIQDMVDVMKIGVDQNLKIVLATEHG